MELYTERLHLRPWKEADAEKLYEYAKDPRVGPAAGWPVHTSVENSREIIRTVLSHERTWAICLRENDHAIGSLGLYVGEESPLCQNETEGEIGYWIGVPFWGQGLVPEAVRELQRYAFEELGLQRLWCGYFHGNEKSCRAQGKCGFTYHHDRSIVGHPVAGDCTEHVTMLPKEIWENTRK